MSINLFSHNANPDTDRRLCRKSNSYVAQLVREGRAFMIDERRAQLYEPLGQRSESSVALFGRGLIRGKNSCRKLGDATTGVFYKVDHFHYPIPAVGGRKRNTPVRVINAAPEEVTAEKTKRGLRRFPSPKGSLEPVVL